MSVKLLTEHHLEILSLKRGCIGSSESTLVKMPHCWKSHVAALLSVVLPHGPVGWSAVCDCGISRPYSLVFFFCKGL